MFRNETVLVWILSHKGFYFAYCNEFCLDGDGTLLDCHDGCCGERINRYCCTFHLWVIILFSIAGAAVLFPAVCILYCLIKDKLCPSKPLVQENNLRQRQTVQLRAINNVHCTSSNAADPSITGGVANYVYFDPHPSTTVTE